MARRFGDLLHRLVGGLVSEADVGGVALDLGGVLVGADRVRIRRVGALARIGEQELVLGAVGLLDIDHHEVGVRMGLDGTLADIGLVAHEGLHHVLVHRLDLDVGEVGEARAQALRDAEVGLRTPEPDVVVDVVDVGENRRVARDVVGTVAGEAHHREVRRQCRDEVGGTDLGAAALEEERRVLATEPGISRPGRRCMERTCGDAAVLVEEHQRVVVHLAIVRGVDRGDADRVFDVKRRRIGAGRGCSRGT